MKKLILELKEFDFKIKLSRGQTLSFQLCEFIPNSLKTFRQVWGIARPFKFCAFNVVIQFRLYTARESGFSVKFDILMRLIPKRWPTRKQWTQDSAGSLRNQDPRGPRTIEDWEPEKTLGSTGPRTLEDPGP